MIESAATLLARFEGRFELQCEYSGGEGRTLRVRSRRGARDLVLKVLPPGVEPAGAGGSRRGGSHSTSPLCRW